MLRFCGGIGQLAGALTTAPRSNLGVFMKPFLSFSLVVLALLSAADGVAQDAAYRVLPGDILAISVWREPELQGQVLLRPDGGFSFPLVGEVDARNKTPAELQQLVSERIRKFIPEAVVTVSVQEIKGNKVYVIGQVNKPGEFPVSRRVDVMQALSMAGGATAFASLGDISVLRRQNGTQKVLPFRYTDVVRGKGLEQNIVLEPGDVVVVP